MAMYSEYADESEKRRLFLEEYRKTAGQQEQQLTDQQTALTQARDPEYLKRQAELDAFRQEQQDSYINKFKQSNIYKAYFYSKSDILKEAADLSKKTGIPQEAILSNSETLARTREVARVKQQLADIGAKGINEVSPEELYQRVPKLKEVLEAKGVADAALVLKTIKDVKETYGTIDTASAMLDLGFYEGEFNELEAKRGLLGSLSPKDEARANELKNLIANSKEMQAGFFDRNIFESIAGGTAYQAGRIWEGNKAGLALGGLVMAGGAVRGGVAGIAGGPAGVLAGATAGAAQSMPWAKRAYQAGVGLSFAWEGTGRYYQEYEQATDAQGKKLYTPRQAYIKSLIQGTVEAGIETFTLGQVGGVIKKATPVKVDLPKVAQALTSKANVKEVTNIIASATSVTAGKSGLRKVLPGMLAASAKTAGWEATEEMTQEATSLLIENIYTALDRRRGFAVDYHSAGDIVSQTMQAGIEALPAAIGFGTIGFGATVPANAYRVKKMSRAFKQMDTGMLKNVEGHAQLDALKQAETSMDSLRNNAPEAQREILQAKFDELGTGKWQIDTELLLQEENGLEIIKALSEAQGLTEEQMNAVVYNQSDLEIDSAAYAMYINNTPFNEVIRQHMTLQQGVPTIARAEQARQMQERLLSVMENDSRQEMDLLEKYIDTVFPNEGVEKEAATASVYRNPQNPAQGWQQLYGEVSAQLQSELAPYLNWMAETGQKGTDTIAIPQEYGNDTYLRVSNNEKWYRDFYEQHKRAPSKAEKLDIAYQMAVGDIVNPLNYNMPQDVLDKVKAELDNAREFINAMDKVRPQLQTMKPAEITLTKNLSQAGYHVYQEVIKLLDQAVTDAGTDTKTRQANRMGAILFARHADVYAQVMREAGNENYTALDYLAKVDIRGGQYQVADGASYSQTSNINTDSEAFRKWFSDSKVVDGSGKPLVVYHGTNAKFNAFDPKKIGTATDDGIWGVGFYFGSSSKTPYGTIKMPVYLQMKKPFVLNDFKAVEAIADYLDVVEENFKLNEHDGLIHFSQKQVSQITSHIKEQGHDGIIVKMGDSWTEYIVFDPNQIKSVDNRGTFSPADNNIYFQADAKAAPVIEIDAKRLPYNVGDKKSVKDWILQNLQGKEVTIKEDGNLQRFNVQGLKSSLKRRGEPHHYAYSVLDKLVENAVYSHFEPTIEKHPQLEGQNVYYAALKIGEDYFTVLLRINVPLRSELLAYKDHKVTKIYGKTKQTRSTNGSSASKSSQTISENESIFNISIDVLSGKVKPSEVRGGVLYQKKSSVNGSIADIKSTGQKVISFFETANKSTFLHELGHLASLDLKELAEVPDAPEWVQRDWATVKKAVKWQEGQADFTEQQQEKLARWFEAYLMSGEAPTRGLKAVFRSFKNWLTHVYNDFSSLGGRAKPEVEAVMARMIASQEEIQAEMDIQDVKAFAKARGLKGVLAQSADMYARWQEEMREEAREKLLAYIMQDLTDEETVQKKLKVEREAYASQMQEQPIWQAYQLWANSGQQDNVALSMGYGTIEQFKSELEAAGGTFEQALDKHMQRFEANLRAPMLDNALMQEQAKMFLADNKYQDMLVAFEYDALRKKMQAAEGQEAAILNRLLDFEKEVSKATELDSLKDKVSELKQNLRWQKAEADLIIKIETAKTKAQMQSAIDELKAQLKKVKENQRVFRDSASNLAKVANDVAQTRIALLPIAQATNLDMWLRKSEQQNRVAAKELAKGNIKEAINAKGLQLAYQSMAKQSARNKKSVDKTVQKLKQQAQIISRQETKFPAAERFYYNSFMYKLGLASKNANQPLTEIPSLSELFLRYQNNLEIEGTIPDWILRAFSDKDFNFTYGQLKLDEFAEIADVLKVLYRVGKSADELKTRPGESFTDVVRKLVEHGYKATSRFVEKNLLTDDNNVLGGKASSGLSHIIKSEVLLELLDGSKSGMIHDILYNTIAVASNNEIGQGLAAGKAIKNLWAPYSEHERYAMAREKRYALPGTNEKLTKEQLMCLALNWGNAANRQRVMSGFELSALEVEMLLSELDTRDWKLINGIWQFINTYWDDTVRVEERMNGVTLQKVEATPFTITDKNGTEHQLDGGYYPIAYNLAKSKRASDLSNDDLAKQMGSARMTLGTRLGMTKSRAQNVQGRPLLLDFSVITDHVADVVHNITLREAVRDINKIVNNEDFATMVTAKLGKVHYDVLQQWAKDLWALEKGTPNERELQKQVKRRRVNANMAIMGYRVSTALLNAANIAPLMRKMGAGRALGAVSDFYTNAQENYKFVMEKSVVLRDRANTVDPNLRELNAQIKPGKYKVVDNIQRHAYDLVTWTDLMLSLPAWLKEYKDTYNAQIQGGSTLTQAEQKAILMADKTVREVFGSGLVQDLSKIQRGSELSKSLTPFYSFFNAQVNVFLESWFQSRNTGNYTEVAKTVMYNFILMSAIETMVRELAKTDDEERDVKYFAKEYVQNLVGNATGGLVVIRDVISVANSLIFDGRVFNKGVPTSLYALSLERLAAFGMTAGSVFSGTGRKDFIDFGYDASRILTAWTGFPDVVPGALWNTMRWFDADFEMDLWDYLKRIAFDKRPKK